MTDFLDFDKNLDRHGPFLTFVFMEIFDQSLSEEQLRRLYDKIHDKSLLKMDDQHEF